MLNKNKKKELVQELAEKIKASKSVVFSDFKGVKVKDLTSLRKELRQEGADLKVYRKTLIDLALKESGIEARAKEMEGQVMVAISATDEIAPAKIISKFTKTNKSLKILGGLLGIKSMSAEEVNALAKLPSKEEMLAKLVGTIKAPVSGFVNVLSGNLRGLVQVLKAVSERK